MLGLNETIDQLAMANSVCWYGHVSRREDGDIFILLTCLTKDALWINVCIDLVTNSKKNKTRLHHFSYKCIFIT